TFSISDWVGHIPPEVLGKYFGVPAASFANFPKREVYIAKGPVPPPLPAVPPPGSLDYGPLTHRYRLLAQRPETNDEDAVAQRHVGVLRLQRFQHALRRERQMAQPLAGQPVECVRDRARDERIADLAQPRRPGVDVNKPDMELLRKVRHAHHVVVVEVRLLHDAVADRDALMQHAREAIENATLHVRLGRGGLHHDAAVDCRPYLVHPDLAARVVERDFDGARAKRACTLCDRDPERPA